MEKNKSPLKVRRIGSEKQYLPAVQREEIWLAWFQPQSAPAMEQSMYDEVKTKVMKTVKEAKVEAKKAFNQLTTEDENEAERDKAEHLEAIKQSKKEFKEAKLEAKYQFYAMNQEVAGNPIMEYQEWVELRKLEAQKARARFEAYWYESPKGFFTVATIPGLIGLYYLFFWIFQSCGCLVHH